MADSKYGSAVQKKLAKIYAECLCFKKAREHSEMAVVIAKVDKSDPSLAFKYRLADCLTKRRLGDFI